MVARKGMIVCDIVQLDQAMSSRPFTKSQAKELHDIHFMVMKSYDCASTEEAGSVIT